MYLEYFSKKMIKFRPVNIAGPTTVVDGTPDNEEINLIASITALYSDKNGDNIVKIGFENGEKKEILNTLPLNRKNIEKFRI